LCFTISHVVCVVGYWWPLCRPLCCFRSYTNYGWICILRHCVTLAFTHCATWYLL